MERRNGKEKGNLESFWEVFFKAAGERRLPDPSACLQHKGFDSQLPQSGERSKLSVNQKH